MSLNSIVRWLKPKEMAFFDLLERAADNLSESVKYFHGALEANDPSKWPEARHRMKELEHVGDDINREIIDHLDRAFITPLERDDILHLSIAIDDVLDLLDGVSEKLVRYKAGRIGPGILEMTGLLVHGASDLVFLVRSLRNMSNLKEIRSKIRLVLHMEDQIDTIYNSIVGELFATSTSAVELIKWKEITEAIEEASDSIALVAKLVGSTVTKNA
jgi:uncharacterized protein Yka (UPF0111/DUF47 family)